MRIGKQRRRRAARTKAALFGALLAAAVWFWSPVPAGHAAVGGPSCTTDPIPVCSGTTASSSTTTGVGTSITGAASALSQFFASQSFQSALNFYASRGTFTGTIGGVATTISTQIFTTLVLGAPVTFYVGDNAYTCDGPPTTWPPGANCTLNPGAIQFIHLSGSINTNVNTHTQIETVLSGESPLFGLVLGDFHTAFQTALLEQNWSVLDALFAQLRGFGLNITGPAAGFGAQFAALGADDARGVNIAQAGVDGRMRPSPWFVWVRPFGTLGKVDSSDERFGFRYDIAGVSAGAEYRWTGPWIAGATLGYAHSSLTQATTGDKGQSDSFQVGAYAGYRSERTHAVIAALFQQNWIASERLTALAPTIATAGYSAQAYSVGVEAGRKYPVMGAWVQPLASLVFTHVRQGGFSENGTTLLEIAGDSTSTNALKLSLGARVWREFDFGWGTITPEFRARWVQDLLNERRAITARFVGDASQTAFSVNGAKPTPAAAVIGGGVTLGAGPGFKVTFAYDAELRANSRSHAIHAQVKLRW